MSRLSIALRALRSLARTPSLLTHVVAGDVSRWQQQALAHGQSGLTAKGLPLVPLTHFLSSDDTTVRPFAFREGGSLPTDLLLLRALARGVPGCRYVEIGTWRGESAANVAEVAAEVYTLNLSDQEIRNLGLPERYIELHGFFSKPLPNVQHLHGNSATYDFAALGGPFDVVFIDGDHRYEAVRTDTARVFEHLVARAPSWCGTMPAASPANPAGKYWPACSTGCPRLPRGNWCRSRTRCAPSTRPRRCPLRPPTRWPTPPPGLK